jgi:hypothetical protein
MFWDAPGSAYGSAVWAHKYEIFDSYTYFVHVPEKILR